MAVLEGKENSGPPREIHDNQGYEGMLCIKLKCLVVDFAGRILTYKANKQGVG
jgi:hypothetical protein